MLQKQTYLLTGLGNPGDAYRMTRHNIGFMVLDDIAGTYDIALNKKSRFNAEYGQGVIEGTKVILAKPMAYMNRSGPCVQKIAGYFNIARNDVLVIYDDIDINFGILKIKEKGGHGGHKGLKSLIEVFNGGDFIRLRTGVGRPEPGINVTDHVLGRFNADEKVIMDKIVTRAREAVVTVLCKGTKHGMNMFNNKNNNNFKLMPSVNG